jgi:hypothetical protein
MQWIRRRTLPGQETSANTIKRKGKEERLEDGEGGGMNARTLLPKSKGSSRRKKRRRRSRSGRWRCQKRCREGSKRVKSLFSSQRIRRAPKDWQPLLLRTYSYSTQAVSITEMLTSSPRGGMRTTSMHLKRGVQSSGRSS